MRGVVVLPFLLVLMVLSACTSSAERVEPLEVINALSDGIQLDVSRDPAFEAADVSVLSGGDYNFGYFNIHVFKDGVDSQDYEIGEPPVEVPAPGETNWGEWEAYEMIPVPVKVDIGSSRATAMLFSQHLSTRKKARGRPALPEGFVLIDSVLSEL